MSLQQHKIDNLYRYYLRNGFQHTADEIVASIGISKKTFFNRYKDKDSSIELVMQYWHQLIQARFREKCMQCNHSVEELLLFIGELQDLRKKETRLYEYECDRNGFLSSKSPYFSMLDHILDHGIRCYHFQDNIDKETYSRFLLYNLTTYCLLESDYELIIAYLLKPLLTERGETLFNEVNLDMLL